MALAESSPTALAFAVRQVRAALAREGVPASIGLARMLRAVLDRQMARMELPSALSAELPGFFTAESRAPFAAESLLDAPELHESLGDPTALGWSYQFWNDADREAIDKRIGPRGRVRLDELASKTQLFTERYMVEWLVQNSVGRLIEPCPEAPYRVERGTGPARRLEDLRILDPACGTGHFLLGAFDFLLAAHRARAAQDFDAGRAALHIISCNLHGIDLDPIAVRISAAALWLALKRVDPTLTLPSLALAATDLATPGPAKLRAAWDDLRWRGSLCRPEAMSEALRAALRQHDEPEDLGVRTDLSSAVGARILDLLSARRYDVVLSNPPYLATAKIELDAARVSEAFEGLPDLFAAFTRRSLELCRSDGNIAFVAPSNWMFLSSFRPVRDLLHEAGLLLIADLGKGAFRHASKLIQTAMVVASPTPSTTRALGLRVGSRDDIDAGQPERIAASLRVVDAFAPFAVEDFAHVEGAPLLFWIDGEFLRRYAELPKIDDVARGAGGIATSNNERFVRAVWEVTPSVAKSALAGTSSTHLPYLKGAEGREWIEPCRSLLRRRDELRLCRPQLKIEVGAQLGVAYTTIGQRFGARLHTTRSVRDVSGASFFPTTCSSAELLCALNKRPVRELACALNPTINFQLGDVRRLPFDRDPHAEAIVSVLREEYERAERGNELSPSFVDPTQSSAWPEAQRWAQRQVDRALGAPLEPFRATRRGGDAHARLSHAIGLAFGRFDAHGLRDQYADGGVPFFVADARGLGQPALAPLRAIWAELTLPFDGHSDLASWLQQSFFADHRRRYEGRPIYLPLSSRRRAVVVWVALHRFYDGLLDDLCARELVPRLAELDAAARAELEAMIANARSLAAVGPPAADDGPPREVDAALALDLEDGVLLNAAALWPLLEPQWKDPRRLWRDLAAAEGKRDYDWSALAARYFPERVRAKCTRSASLAAAHGYLPSEKARSPLARARHPRILEP